MLISTGKSDWPRDVESESGSLAHFLDAAISAAPRPPKPAAAADGKAVAGVYNAVEMSKITILNGSHYTLSDDPKHDTVLVLNTADFWHQNTVQLEDNIKKRVDPEFTAKIDLSSQADTFLGVVSATIQALVHKVEASCEGAWREMKNTNWREMESVGDHSSYVGELQQQVNAKTEEFLSVVAKQQYARAFCDNLVERLATAYINNIVLCRPISEGGAEQVRCVHLGGI